jgi:hypothetical protein
MRRRQNSASSTSSFPPTSRSPWRRCNIYTCIYMYMYIYIHVCRKQLFSHSPSAFAFLSLSVPSCVSLSVLFFCLCLPIPLVTRNRDRGKQLHQDFCLPVSLSFSALCSCILPRRPPYPVSLALSASVCSLTRVVSPARPH